MHPKNLYKSQAVEPLPRFGYVTSQGRDVESARRNLTEAIGLYLETWGIPEQHSYTSDSFWTTVEVAE